MRPDRPVEPQGTGDPGGRRQRAGEMKDTTVPQAGQVTDRLLDPCAVVGDHRRDREVVGPPVDQHHLDLAMVKLVQQRVVDERGGHDQPLDLPGQERGHLCPFPLLVVVGVDDQRAVAGRAEDVFDAADDRREERVGEVRQDQSDRPGLRGLQAAGDGVGRVAEGVGGPHDASGRVDVDQLPGLRVQGPGRGGGMHPGSLRHVLQGGRVHVADPSADSHRRTPHRTASRGSSGRGGGTSGAHECRQAHGVPLQRCSGRLLPLQLLTGG